MNMTDNNRIVTIRNNLQNSSIINDILVNGKEKYINNVLNEIQKTKSDPKKSLLNCTSNSIISAIKQAHDLNLEIDGRQHCHLVRYNKNIGTKQNPNWQAEAQLQVGYRGYIYSIKKAYPDANIDCSLVYEGDNLIIRKEGDLATYSLEVNDPFATDRKIKGGFCYISYTLNGKPVSFIESMPLAEINKIKNCAKSDSIWSTWFEEKAKVAIIRRACKVHFSSIQQVVDLSDYDNKDFEVKSKTANLNDFSFDEVGIVDSKKEVENE